MRIVVSAEGTERTSPIDPRFGRARWFVLHDTETGAYEPFENARAAGLAHGAGVEAAQRVIGRCPDFVLTGDCGPNAVRALEAAGVKLVTGVSGSVEEAIARFRGGTLRPGGGGAGSPPAGKAF